MSLPDRLDCSQIMINATETQTRMIASYPNGSGFRYKPTDSTQMFPTAAEDKQSQPFQADSATRTQFP